MAELSWEGEASCAQGCPPPTTPKRLASTAPKSEDAFENLKKKSKTDESTCKFEEPPMTSPASGSQDQKEEPVIESTPEKAETEVKAEVGVSLDENDLVPPPPPKAEE